jgi:hypothetical protein
MPEGGDCVKHRSPYRVGYKYLKGQDKKSLAGTARAWNPCGLGVSNVRGNFGHLADRIKA